MFESGELYVFDRLEEGRSLSLHVALLLGFVAAYGQ